MPAPQRYAAPHEQIRMLAVEARAEGLSFDEFWERAIRPGISPIVTTETARKSDPPHGAVVWPKDSSDRANAIAATNSAKEFWRRAYEGVPQTKGERALSLLHSVLTGAGGSKDGSGLTLASR